LSVIPFFLQQQNNANNTITTTVTTKTRGIRIERSKYKLSPIRPIIVNY